MRATSSLSLTESYWMLFAMWGLGLAGVPADLDEASTVNAPAALQQPLQAAGDANNRRSVH